MSHPTREALLNAGLRLAEKQPLAEVSINDIVAEAGNAKGTFYVHFPDRAAYLVALHRLFHDRLNVAVLAAIDGMPPSAARLQRGVEAYLDGCLRERGVKALLLEARSVPAILSEVLRRNAEFSRLAQADFAAIGWAQPLISARLYIVMVAEAALLELEAGHAQADVRVAITEFANKQA